MFFWNSAFSGFPGGSDINPPTVQETWVLSLDQEDPLEKEMATPQAEACQAPLAMEFSRQEYWSGLLFPPPVSFSLYTFPTPAPNLHDRYYSL